MPEPEKAVEGDEQAQTGPSAEKPTAHPGGRVLKGALDALSKYWQLIVALVSIGIALIGWVGLGVSPLEGMKEIQNRMGQRKSQQELARRHIDLGNRFLDVGQTKAAEVEFRQAKELDKYNEEADLGLLKTSVFEPVVEKEYDPEVAKRRIDAILQLKGHDKDTHALAYLGDVYSNINRERAMDYYERALASDDKNAWAFYGKGLLVEQEGNRDLALQMYDKAIEISELNHSFLNNAAYQHFLQHDYVTAEQMYVQVVNSQPDFLLSYCYLANTQWVMGQTKLVDRNLEPLEEKLPLVIKLKINQPSWMIQVKDQNDLVYLYSPEEKMAYLRYLLALARQLAGRPKDARRELEKEATESRGHDISQARRVLESDIANIERNPGFAEELHAFKLMLKSRSLQ